MKRIDRYIARGFLVRVLVANLIIYGLYVSFDALKRIDQLDSETVRLLLPRLLEYYAYQFPTRVLEMVSPLLLLGAGLMMVQMGRNGELLALKAGGVSVRRASLPIFVCTIPVIALMFWAKETVVPVCYRRQELLDRELEKKVAGPFVLPDAKNHLKIYVASYDFAGSRMSRVMAFEFGAERQMRRIITADSGEWRSDSAILLTTVSIQELDEKGQSFVGRPTVQPVKIIPTVLTPYDFVRARSDVLTPRMPAMSTPELRAEAKAHPGNPRFSVMLQTRLSDLLAPIALLLIGIPLLIWFEHSLESRTVGAVVCIVVAGAFQVLSFVAVSMGSTGHMAPTLAAWIMPGAGIIVGGWMFATMQT